MKTLLFSPMWIDEEWRKKRHIKWEKFYEERRDNLHFDQVLFVDNASCDVILRTDSKLPVTTIRCAKYFSRLTHYAYGYWYRAFRRALEYAIAQDYEKIIHLDTDVFILKDRICDHINKIDSGWVSFWCPMYRFPETAMQVICRDQMQNALNFFTEGFLEFYPYGSAEEKVPLTHIEKGFIGDRYGEQRLPQTMEMDYYCQAVPEIDLVYEMKNP